AEGYGFDILLNEQNYYHVRAYPDQNERDLLLAFTESTREEIAAVSERTDPFIWNMMMDEEPDDNHGEMPANLADDGYSRIRENLNFDTIVIDAGHGGKDPGTIGYNGLREKEITLNVAFKLGGYIEEHLPDINVIYTREADNFVELQERGRVANRARGDLFVSIHANAYRQNTNVRGSEVYFLGLARSESALDVMKRENSVVRLEDGNGMDELSEEDLLIYELANAGNISISERIAGKLDYQFRERAQRPSRGVKQAQFVVLYHASMPALLVELGFITNSDEARYLSSDYGQSIVASAIFRAIRDYKVEYEQSRNVSSTN
ncbi:MAG: N-acetylmuramoyl-L-alanine amidase, partial [Balneolaceae bacterium]